MKSVSFIKTPIKKIKDQDDYTEENLSFNGHWMNRARKLRERRWKSNINRFLAHEDYSSYKPRYSLNHKQLGLNR